MSSIRQQSHLQTKELLEPAAKPGGRPREVEIWNILNAILYLLSEGWRSLPGDFSMANSLHLLSQLAHRRDMGEFLSGCA